jgi:hypothetical protein
MMMSEQCSWPCCRANAKRVTYWNMPIRDADQAQQQQQEYKVVVATWCRYPSLFHRLP